jgi:hypothetical protein
MFHPEIGAVFGERFVSLDLDCVIVSDMRPVWNRSEDIVLWGDTNPRTHYNGSMVLMTAGSRPQVWTTFHPKRSPMASRLAGCHGSDQGWISHCLGKGEKTWGRSDGVYSYRLDIARRQNALPENARITFWHGPNDPWDAQAQRIPWVQEHWR